MRSSVLIVDDELGIRELVKRWLTAETYVALEARTAEEAVDVAERNRGIKVAVVDLQMPGLGGAWLIDQLQRSFPHISIILATANSSVPGTLSLKPGVIGYVVKPLTPKTLLPLIADGVRRSDESIETERRRGANDSIESFLDRKLTRGDGNDRTK
jgi:two-component system alkaline phosphatase synthesis response regulator PhoP